MLAGRRRPTAWAVALVAAAVAVGATGCADQGDRDPLQVADVLQEAAPAASPASTVRPAGRVLPLDGAARASLVDPSTRTLAVVVDGPDRVLLYGLDRLDGPPRVVPLPGPVERLGLGRAGEVLAPVRSAGVVVRIATASASVETVPVAGGPTAAVGVDGRTVVALADRHELVVLDGDRVVRTIDGPSGPADLVAVDGRVAVLDRLRTALATVDPVSGDRGPALRAGDGAAGAVADRFGRVLVADVRDGELLAFSADPMIMRQRYPVAGAPYAIAYDPVRDLAWVTLTGRNEVVGFDVAGGEPVERYRMATVRQPNTVAVDPGSGAVIVASGTGEGIQVVSP